MENNNQPKTGLEMANDILKSFASINELVQKAKEAPARIVLDYSKIDDVQVEGIDGRDAPDFCDAFICSASYDGRDMTDEELEILNDDRDYVYNAVEKQLY